MNFDLKDATIFLTLAGSQAHGTAREGSDVDLRGVCIAPRDERLSLFRTFEQHDGGLPTSLEDDVLPRLRHHPTAHKGLDEKIECVIFDIAKFLRLLANANPSALEVLFADEQDWALETPEWRTLHAQRHIFLTMKVQQTFQGYAMAQLKKIRTHRAWLLDPPKAKPERGDFALPIAGGTLNRDDQNRIEQSIADKVRSYGVDDIEMPKASRIAVSERLGAFYGDVLGAEASGESEVEERMRAVATHALSLPPEVAKALNAEKKYRAAMKHWEAYRAWKLGRNAARAKLEAEHGYDTKHAMHLIRLMRMGHEVLVSGELRVRRADHKELSEIRDGSLSYDALLEEATRLQEAMKVAAAAAKLPRGVDPAQVDALALSLMR
ncbi:MAG: nucleotidyltransferase domain-containing protein [Polyangiales bacterium]